MLGNDHLTSRGGYVSKKNILIPNVAEKNILILVKEKNNNLIQSFCHITKKINILTLVLSEKKFLNEAKNHNPPLPLQVTWSVP